MEDDFTKDSIVFSVNNQSRFIFDKEENRPFNKSFPKESFNEAFKKGHYRLIDPALPTQNNRKIYLEKLKKAKLYLDRHIEKEVKAYEENLKANYEYDCLAVSIKKYEALDFIERLGYEVELKEKEDL